MIAPRQNLPLVQWRDERHIPLSEGWLAESIEQSALCAGHPGCAWGPDVARAITFYLEQEFAGNVITTDHLQQIIRKSLNGIGYPDVARRAMVVAPRVSIYLPELARHAGFELMFFQLLRDRLQEALHLVVRGVRLEGLRPCVKMIENARHWQKDCELLSDEIVLFSRQHINRWNRPPIDLVIN